MSEPFSEELLSAYVDGELSAQERAEVERWVEHSPDARQRLEDFRRLSRLFGGLSRTEVPPEFPTEVLHLAERRMLLPEAAAAHGRKRIRGWALALAAPTAAAAVLLLIFKISNRDDAARDRAVIVADRTNKAPAPWFDDAVKFNGAAQAGKLEDLANRPGKREQGIGKQPDALIAQDEPRSHTADRPMIEGLGTAPLPTRGPASSDPAPPAGTGGGGFAKSSTAAPGPAKSKFAATASEGALPSNIETDPQLLALNEVVQYIRESGEADKVLSVVRLYVADRAEGLILLQEDFAANNIRIDLGETMDDKATDGEQPRGEASDEGLYVVAQADELIAGFKAFLARRHPGARVSVEQSIELADLDEESQKQFLLGDGEQPLDQLRRGDEVAKKTKDVPEVAKSAISRAARPAAGAVQSSKPDAADALPVANQMANNARQMVVPVLPPAIQNRPRSSGATNSQAARKLARSQKQNAPIAPAEAKSRDEKPLVQDEKLDESPPALVRMLIVIEREPQRPDAPAAKKGPSGGPS